MYVTGRQKLLSDSEEYLYIDSNFWLEILHEDDKNNVFIVSYKKVSKTQQEKHSLENKLKQAHNVASWGIREQDSKALGLLCQLHGVAPPPSLIENKSIQQPVIEVIIH